MGVFLLWVLAGAFVDLFGRTFFGRVMWGWFVSYHIYILDVQNRSVNASTELVAVPSDKETYLSSKSHHEIDRTHEAISQPQSGADPLPPRTRGPRLA